LDEVMLVQILLVALLTFLFACPLVAGAAAERS
jgi:hypothetical protein